MVYSFKTYINNKEGVEMDKICESCCRLSGEIPGLFLDFDADPNQGGDGIPLCSSCLGTGIDLSDKSEFAGLTDELRKIRSTSLANQIERKEGWQDRLKEAKERTIEIAKLVNLKVDNKVEGCYGDELSKEK